MTREKQALDEKMKTLTEQQNQTQHPSPTVLNAATARGMATAASIVMKHINRPPSNITGLPVEIAMKDVLGAVDEIANEMSKLYNPHHKVV
jgi:hypothetical protein